jgi:hypothetical protein
VAALPPWFLKATRYKYGLIPYKPRPKDFPAQITRAKWPQVYKEWDQFDLWNPWRVGHKALTRPKVWKTVPGWAWTIAGELDKQHAQPPPKPKPPPAPPLPKPSWSLPGPFVMESNPGSPGSANGKAGVGTIGRIIDQIEACPMWECRPVSGSGRGLCGQIEGEHQVDQAKELFKRHRQPGDHLAIVGTLNVKAKPLLDIGVNFCWAELNAQSGWEPYGNAARLLAQAFQDGWVYAEPSYGCYWSTGLDDYQRYVPMIWDYTKNDFVQGTKPQGLPGRNFAIFSAEGATDAGGTWEVVARL